MGQKFARDPAGHGRGYPVIGANSEAFAFADPVYIDTSGWLALATTSSKILGFYVGAGETMASDNQTVAKKTPDYVYASGVEMVYGADQDATQTDVGAYADIGTATTGAIELNLAAGSTGQFFVIGFDPENDSTDTDIVVIVAEPQISAFAQA